MATPEELEAQRLAAEKQIRDAAALAASGRKSLTLDGDDIPEAFRGKPAKEVIDQLLNTSLEIEKSKKALADKELEIEQLRRPAPTPRGKEEELSPEEIEAAKERELLTRPIRYLDKHLDERLKPLTDTYLASQSATVKELMSRKLKGFDKMEKRIDEYVSKVPMEARINPQVWEGAWKLARLDELDEREKEFNTKSGLAPDGSTPSLVKLGGVKVELTEEERAVAKRWNMTEADYIKYQKNATEDDF